MVNKKWLKQFAFKKDIIGLQTGLLWVAANNNVIISDLSNFYDWEKTGESTWIPQYFFQTWEKTRKKRGNSFICWENLKCSGKLKKNLKIMIYFLFPQISLNFN